MIFCEDLLLADDSPEISFLIFFEILGKMLQNLSSAAVMIGFVCFLALCPKSTAMVMEER